MGFSGRFMRACFVFGGGGGLGSFSGVYVECGGGLGVTDRRFLQGVYIPICTVVVP